MSTIAVANFRARTRLVYPARTDAWPTSASAVSMPTEKAVGEGALAELYEKYAPAIYAHCRRLLHSPVAARDATQEAFVRVLARGPAELAGEDALRYLYRVSTNVCLNQLREQKVHERAAPAIMARTANLRSAEGGHADRQFVLALLDRCDHVGSSIAVMHYVDGMSQVEIAEILGITRRTVFNRLRKLEKIAAELMQPPAGAPSAATPTDEMRGKGKEEPG